MDEVKGQYQFSGSRRFGKLERVEEIKTKHEHWREYTETTKKVLLTGGAGGYDILKQRVCSCGRVETYDIKERRAR